MAIKSPLLTESDSFARIPLSILADNADIDRGRLEDIVIPPLHKLKALGFKRSKLRKVSAIGVNLPNLSLQDCELEELDFSGASIGEAYLERCTFMKSRLSGSQLYEGAFVDVVFVDCKLDMANFRFSKLKRVEFRNCILVDADFSGATMSDVSILDSDLDKANFNGSKIDRLNLSGSLIAGVRGTVDLKGATITADQLISLAPALARDVGIKVEDE